MAKNKIKRNKNKVTKQPISKDRPLLNRKPNFRNTNRGFIVKHTEQYLSMTATGAAFYGHSASFNVSSTNVFSWLAPIANRFEKYIVHDFEIHFVPMVPSTTVGIIGFYFDYDPTDAVATTFQEFMSNDTAVAGAVWSDKYIKLNPKRIHDVCPALYTSDGLTTDHRTSQMGRLHWYTDAGPGTTCGHVYFKYTIELVTPQIQRIMSVPYNNFASNGPVPKTSTVQTVLDFLNTGNAESILRTGAGVYKVLKSGYYKIRAAMNATSDTAGSLGVNNILNVNGTAKETVDDQVNIPANGKIESIIKYMDYFKSDDIISIYNTVTGSGTLNLNDLELNISAN